jgi:CheY-like chemotaxis protein
MDGSGLRVLAAEDNPVNQLVLKAMLAPIGIEPVLVENGALALEAWAEGDFDVILMDIQMPQMDGLEAARAIRDQEAKTGRRRTPIIALTANAMSHQVAEYFACGMDAHIPKPIDRHALCATLDNLLKQGPAAVDETCGNAMRAVRR